MALSGPLGVSSPREAAAANGASLAGRWAPLHSSVPSIHPSRSPKGFWPVQPGTVARRIVRWGVTSWPAMLCARVSARESRVVERRDMAPVMRWPPDISYERARNGAHGAPDSWYSQIAGALESGSTRGRHSMRRVEREHQDTARDAARFAASANRNEKQP